MLFFHNSKTVKELLNTHHGKTKSQKGLIQSIEGCPCVLDTAGTLQTTSVETNIPVGQISDEIEKLGDDSVESVSRHLGLDMLDQCLTSSQDPSVHDVCGLFGVVIVHKLLACSLLEKFNLTKIKVERVDPLEDNVGQNLSHTFLTESEVVGSHNWGINQEKSDTISTVLVDDLHRVWVVLELFGHLFAVANFSVSI